MRELRMPDGHSIYIGTGAKNMTMSPQEAMNVMQMAQNIQDLNTKVAMLESKMQMLEAMIAGQQGQVEPNQNFGPGPDRGWRR